MAVTIKELIFRAVVSGESESEDAEKEEKNEREREELISSCVSQVLRILERKNER